MKTVQLSGEQETGGGMGSQSRTVPLVTEHKYLASLGFDFLENDLVFKISDARPQLGMCVSSNLSLHARSQEASGGVHAALFETEKPLNTGML
jgi:hypothetical protein